LIIGGGPAGTQAATTAASKGARVTLIEKDIVGGAAHLWDCIPSKTMAASALRHTSIRNAAKLGFVTEVGRVDPKVLSERIEVITGDINRNWVSLLESQGVLMIEGTGRFASEHEVVVSTSGGDRRINFDKAMVSTGSAPRVPEWAPVDGKRVLTTRDAYFLDEVPEHIVVIGSGVTGVEFTHIFESLGAKVSLVVSRQQILPYRDAEVAAVLEEDFLERGVRLVIGARAERIEMTEDSVSVVCDDGRVIQGSHALLAVGSYPLSEGLELEAAGIESQDGYITVDDYQRSSASHIYAAGYPARLLEGGRGDFHRARDRLGWPGRCGGRRRRPQGANHEGAVCGECPVRPPTRDPGVRKADFRSRHRGGARWHHRRSSRFGVDRDRCTRGAGPGHR
jgi:dihydrolipoamide dehydrogenase